MFGVPERRFDAINERFRKEATTIKEAFVARLGAAPKFILRPHDFDARDALRPAPAAASKGNAAAEPSPPAEEEEDTSISTSSPTRPTPRRTTPSRV